MQTVAYLSSLRNDCLWYDKLWGPSQRVVTLFSAEKGEGGEAREHECHLQRSDRICLGTAKGRTAKKGM